MPLEYGYGVVVGTFESLRRGHRDGSGRWVSGRLTLNTRFGPFQARIPLGAAGIRFRLIDGLTPASLPLLHGLPSGYTPLAPVRSSGALDYTRSAVLVDSLFGSVRSSVHHYRCSGRPVIRRGSPWLPGQSERPVTAFETALESSRKVMVLGEPTPAGRRLRGVHLNQGYPVGPRAADNGPWQDGAVICSDATGNVQIWQFKFQTQTLHVRPDGWAVDHALFRRGVGTIGSLRRSLPFPSGTRPSQVPEGTVEQFG